MVLMVVSLNTLALLALLALLILTKSFRVTVTFAVLYGFDSGSFVSFPSTLLAQISKLPQMGSRQGACFAIQSLADLTSAPIAVAIVVL